MMLELKYAESNKAISSVVVSVFLILISVLAVLILGYMARQIILSSPIESSCIDFSGNIDACYLNEQEIQIIINRGFDNIDAERIRFGFYPRGVWEITGEKCLDVRLKDRIYGNYCDIIDKGQELVYVINVSDIEKPKSVKIAIGNNNLCQIGEKEIKSSCS